jgi:hypothetical protein
MIDLSEYFSRRKEMRTWIQDLLGIRIDDLHENHYLKREYKRIFENVHYYEYRDRFLYFKHFIKQLSKIKSYRIKDYNDYLKKFAVEGDNIVGEKFEVLTYARLIDNVIDFIKPKKNPDFNVKMNGQSVFIECGTRQTNKKGFFIESIEQAIDKKQILGLKQGYANRNTALHIEISKTVYNSHGEADFLNDSILKSIIKKKINEVGFGSLVVIYTFYGKENGIVYGQPFFEYHKDCNPLIREMHSLMFHIHKQHITGILREFT